MKILSSIIRRRLYNFLIKNSYVERDIQKGFWDNVPGTIEHNELLTYMINHARKRQRDLFITLIDLRNAFGEVHHSLLNKVLEYHHVPIEVKSLIQNMYKDFHISVGTKRFITDRIKVERGVLQGDCLSPLLFNMCFNTLIQTIRQKKINCLGYAFDYTLQPRHWFQFADDTAIATSSCQENQYLLNLFTKWATWANFIVRVEKCKSFGMTKNGTYSTQIEPTLIICREKIPVIKCGESFEYLGKTYNLDMNCKEVRKELEDKVMNYLSKTDKLPLHPRYKIMILTRYVFSKLRWSLTVYEFPLTWLKQNLDSSVLYYVRRWFQFHPGANTTHLTLPSKYLGAGVSLISDLFEKCQLSKRTILKGSSHADIKKLYYLTSDKYISSNEIIEGCKDFTSLQNHVRKRSISKALEKKRQESVWNNFIELKEQNILIKSIVNTCTSRAISQWQKTVQILPPNIFCFCRRYLISSLPTNANLARWRKIASENCSLCGIKQTQRHVVSFCSSALNNGRFTWRHNSVLYTICQHLSSLMKNGDKLFADLIGFESTSSLFESSRPDACIVTANGEVLPLELTVCHELNFEKARDYKEKRYRDLREDLKINCNMFEISFIEISALGFVPTSIKEFKKRVIDLE